MSRSQTARMQRGAKQKEPARKPVPGVGNVAPPIPKGARIDFSELTLQDALDLAILVEEEAQERYQKLAEMVGGGYAGDASDVFQWMVKNEARHGAELAERRDLLFEKARSRISREVLFDVEAPDWSEVRVFMSARQAMEVALGAEEKACEFFEQALPHVKDAQVRKLFEELRDEERKHAMTLRQKMRGLPSGPDVEAEMADEPGSDPG